MLNAIVNALQTMKAMSTIFDLVDQQRSKTRTPENLVDACPTLPQTKQCADQQDNKRLLFCCGDRAGAPRLM